jgi:hypothetical protein
MSFDNTFAVLGIGFNGQDSLSVGFGHISHDIITQPQKRRAIVATVIDWLKNNRTPTIWHTFEEIFEAADDGRCVSLSVEAKNKLKADMRANPKIQTDNDNVAYKVCKTNTQTNKQNENKFQILSSVLDQHGIYQVMKCFVSPHFFTLVHFLSVCVFVFAYFPLFIFVFLVC